jgi:myosin heavy subunit
LFHLINESSELNKPDENLPETIIKNHQKNEFLQIPKGKKGLFLINHSCSPVNYSTSGFTNRNKDEFPQQLLDAIVNGKDEVLKRIIIGDGKA